MTTFLGWCLLINMGLLVLTTIALVFRGDWISGIHSSLFGIGQAELRLSYFQYLANYKIAVVVLNLVPYVALKLMS